MVAGAFVAWLTSLICPVATSYRYRHGGKPFCGGPSLGTRFTSWLEKATVLPSALMIGRRSGSAGGLNRLRTPRLPVVLAKPGTWLTSVVVPVCRSYRKTLAWSLTVTWFVTRL